MGESFIGKTILWRRIVADMSCEDRNVKFLELIVAGSSHHSYSRFPVGPYRSERGRVIGSSLTPIVTRWRGGSTHIHAHTGPHALTHTGPDADDSCSYCRGARTPLGEIGLKLFIYSPAPGFIYFPYKMMNGVTRSLCTFEDIRNQDHVSNWWELNHHVFHVLWTR